MGYLDKEMKAAYNKLYDFIGNYVQLVGHVNLPIALGMEPLSATQFVEFMVMNKDISYNSITGRPLPKKM